MWAASRELAINGRPYIHNVEGMPGIPTDWTIEIGRKPKTLEHSLTFSNYSLNVDFRKGDR